MSCLFSLLKKKIKIKLQRNLDVKSSVKIWRFFIDFRIGGLAGGVEKIARKILTKVRHIT